MRPNLLFILGTALVFSSCQQSGKVGTDSFATINYSEQATRDKISETLRMQFSIVEESARPLAKVLRLILEAMDGSSYVVNEKMRFFILDEQLVGMAENLRILSGTSVKLDGNKFKLRAKSPIKRSLLVKVDNQEAELRIDGEVSNKGEIISYEVHIGMNGSSYKIATYSTDGDLVFSSKKIEDLLIDHFLDGKKILNGVMDEEGLSYKVDIKNRNAYLIKHADIGELEYQLFDSPYFLIIDSLKLVISKGKLQSIGSSDFIQGRIMNVETASIDPLVVFDNESFEISYEQIKENEEIHFSTRKLWNEL